MNKKYIKIFLIDLGMLLLAYGGFWREGFGADTLSQFAIPLINIETWITYGRFLAYAVNYALYNLGINTVYHYHIFYLFFMVVCAASLGIYQMVFIELFEKKLNGTLRETGFFALTGIIFINGFFCENYMFPECFIGFSLAFLFSALGTFFITRGKYFSGGISLLVSALFYQAPVILSAIAVTFYFYMKSKGRPGKKELLTGFFTCIYAAFLALVTTMTGGQFAKMLGDTPKALEFAGIKSEIMRIVSGFMSFLKSGYNLLPPVYLPLIIMAIPIAFCLFTGIFKGTGMISKWIWYIALHVILFGMAFLLSRGEATPRLLGGLYMTLAVLYMIPLVLSEDKRADYLWAVAIAFFVIQVVFTNMVMMNHYISNELDINAGKLAYNEILKYEQETGNTVTKVARTTDESTFDTWPGVYYRCGQINERVMNIVPYSLLVYSSAGRSYEIVQMDKDIEEEYFAGKDWDSFDADEQMIFLGDTLYWCIY